MRRAEGEQQPVERVLAVGAAHAHFHGDADDAGDARRDDERQRVAPAERQLQPLRGEIGGQRRPRPGQLQGEVGAEREQRAVRQVDLLHQPDDQHEAERDEREQQAEHQAVDDVRQQIEHGLVPGEEAAGPATARPGRCVSLSGIDRRHLLVGHELALAGRDVVLHRTSARSS